GFCTVSALRSHFLPAFFRRLLPPLALPRLLPPLTTQKPRNPTQRLRTRAAWVIERLPLRRAHNSAVECVLHTDEVAGSNPAAPPSAQLSNPRSPRPGFAREGCRGAPCGFRRWAKPREFARVEKRATLTT